ncbi:hypothetical protein ACWCP6_17910 [Streptomyces sp. NPDC002004]
MTTAGPRGAKTTTAPGCDPAPSVEQFNESAYQQIGSSMTILPQTSAAPQADGGALAALIAEHNLQIEEWDTATLPEPLRPAFLAFYCRLDDGSSIVVVPLGQNPAERLTAIRELIAHAEVQA